MSGSQFEHGKEVGGVLFVARREPPEMLDAVEEPFDAVACAVEYGTEARLPPAVNHSRDVWCRTDGFDGFDASTQPIRIVDLCQRGQWCRAVTSRATVRQPDNHPPDLLSAPTRAASRVQARGSWSSDRRASGPY